MNRTQSLSRRIDAAFGPLLMAKDLLDQLIPNSDDLESIARAAELAEELVGTAIERLEAANPRDATVVEFAAPAKA